MYSQCDFSPRLLLTLCLYSWTPARDKKYKKGVDLCNHFCIYCCSAVHAVLQTLWPQAAPAGSTASLYGYSTWLLDQDCSAALEFAEGTPPSCIGTVMFNGWLCTVAGPDAWARASYSRFNWAWMFRLNCSLPNPSVVSGTEGLVSFASSGSSTVHKQLFRCSSTTAAAP
jgi:hypothetical protein